MDPKKKSLSASERDEAKRAEWRDAAGALDPAGFVFLDECGTHPAHTRAYGRAPRNERAVGRVPRNRGKVTTLIASLPVAGIGPTTTLVGGTTKPAFLTYLEEVLAPSLRPGQVVGVDNLGAHRAAEARTIVEERQATLRYLPPYSPDCNPIELAFGPLKATLRRAEARTREGLEAAIGDALATITAEHARGFFAHCGYPLPDQPLRRT